MLDYDRYMLRCLQLARLGEMYVAPNPMVGAVLVGEMADGAELILAEGYHRVFGGPHAEVNCFNDYLSRTENTYRTAATLETRHESSTLFVSLEPCSHYGKTPPCADLIISKRDELRIRRVVVGCLDANPKVAGRGIDKLQQAGIEVITGVREKECRELNKRFFMLHEHHRPYVILKWAQTADGYMGARAERVQISNMLTKQIVHQMRAENMAIMIGANTALIDNPRLLTTHWQGRNPIRVLLDRHGRVPATYNIFSQDAPTIVYSDDTRWQTVLADMAKRDIHSVLVEGGAELLKNILHTGIYDEVHIEVNEQLRIKDKGYPEGSLVEAPHINLPTEPQQSVLGNRLYVLTH